MEIVIDNLFLLKIKEEILERNDKFKCILVNMFFLGQYFMNVETRTVYCL